MQSDAWKAKLAQMVPMYNQPISDQDDTWLRYRAYSNHVLHLDDWHLSFSMTLTSILIVLRACLNFHQKRISCLIDKHKVLKDIPRSSQSFFVYFELFFEFFVLENWKFKQPLIQETNGTTFRNHHTDNY